MGKVFVMGDIHGAHKALKQCLERSNFNKEEDVLIQLGDVVDGWSEVYDCVEELLSIKNLISIRGNHDDFFVEWMTKGIHPCHWLQGGDATLKSYCDTTGKLFTPRLGGWVSNMTILDVPENHREFFKNQIPYYIDQQNRLYVHGGFNRHFSIIDKIYNSPQILMWDRDLFMQALSYEAYNMNQKQKPFKIKDNFKEVFIGHTATINFNTDKPLKAGPIWNLDTGAGFKGKLTIMEVSTKKYWQSDEVSELYQNERGRN